MHALGHLGRREPAHGISRAKLANNPYWPAELQASGAPAARALRGDDASSAIEDSRRQGTRPLDALRRKRTRTSRTPFGRARFTAPRSPLDPEHAIGFFTRLLLATVYQEPVGRPGGTAQGWLAVSGRCKAAQGGSGKAPSAKESTSGAMARAEVARVGPRSSSGSPVALCAALSTLFTFQPFASLPAPARKAYLAGAIASAAVPGQSLLFLGRRALFGDAAQVAAGVANSTAALDRSS